MRKYVSHLLLALFSMLFVDAAFAQQVDSMMSVYADQAVPEKIHIHFDKTIYNRGETVWYKVYVLQRGDTTSKNVYLEWYDADGKLVKNTVAPVLLSSVQGSFDIPSDYKSERLYVRAYTRWMLNDDPAFSYRRELVVNTVNPKANQTVTTKTTVETFPEGGFLIQGLHTRVAFKASNQYGKPVFIKGVLTDNSNNVLDSLSIKHDGMGSFYFIPLAGQTYQLNWIDENGATGSTPIPITKTEGANITISAANGKAKFQVHRTDSASENFKKMTLLVHMNQVTLFKVDINTSVKNTLNSEIPIGDLPTGLLQFTLFTADWLPVAERVIFVNNRSHEFNVKLKTSLVNTEKRGKNVLDISVPDTLFTNMSLSITDAETSPLDQHSIFSDLLLSSEIKGIVYNPGYYLASDADSITANLDLVMLTHGWRRFDWDKIKAHVSPKIIYPVEHEYMKMNGKVLGLKRNATLQTLNMIVVGKDSSKQLIFVPVEKDGKFEYPIAFFDTAKVFYNFNNNTSLTEDVTVQISNSMLKQSPKNMPLSNNDVFIWNDNPARQKLNNLLAEQELLKKQMADATLKEVIVTAKVKTKEQILDERYSTGFFSDGPVKKNYVFDLTDPTLLFATNIIEYLQSKVPGLDIIYISPGSYQISWRGDQPTFFLDQMQVEMSHAISLPLNNIAMIKAFPPLFMFATGGGRGGAIAIYTKKGGDYKSNTDLKGLENTILAGYSTFKEFYNPSYEQPAAGYTKPDTRTTLYWNPYLITNSTLQHMKVEFFNNDFTKTFNVVLEGMNAAGKMTRIVKTIDANTRIE